MCGIAVISPIAGTSLDVRALTSALLVALEARGRDASGYAWRDDKGETWIVKEAITGRRQAARLAKHPGTLDTGATAVIVHTRWSTIGDPAVYENNHPVLRPGVCLVHNGYVRNHRTITADHGIERNAVVDTDVLAAMVEMHPTTDDLLGAFGDVEGAAAIAWLDARNTGGLVHASRVVGQTLVVGQTADGDTIACSTETLMRKACQTVGVTLDWVAHLEPGTYVAMDRGVITEWRRYSVRDDGTFKAPNYSRASTYRPRQTAPGPRLKGRY